MSNPPASAADIAADPNDPIANAPSVFAPFSLNQKVGKLGKLMPSKKPFTLGPP